jgi:RNA polymerase sigma-70 factor (ECF subfamily)
MSSLSLRDIWRKCLDTPADAEVWEEFLHRTYPVLSRIARNVAAASGIDRREDIDDLLQEICAKISHPSFLRSFRLPADDTQAELYFRATAANAARDSLKTRFATKRGERVTFSMENHLAELVDEFAVSSIQRQILIREIDELLEATTAERSIFWLYYRQGLTSKEIAAVPAIGLSAKGVESALQRMTSAVRTRLKIARADRTGSGSNSAG